MRVAFKQDQKSTGLIFKKPQYVVTCTVEFSDEEKSIIKRHQLGRFVVHSYRSGSKEHHLLVNDLLKRPFVQNCPLPSSAREFEVYLTERLASISETIRENADIDHETKFVDL